MYLNGQVVIFCPSLALSYRETYFTFKMKKCDNLCDCNVMFMLGSLFSWLTWSEFFLANLIETAMINCSSQDDSDSSIWCKHKVEKQRKI